MSQRRGIASRSEVAKLARVLRREPSELHYLESLDAEDVRLLREQVTEKLFTANARTLGRLAAASRLLPVAVIAIIAERAFGPVLAALIAGRVEPSRAVDVAARLPAPFLAEIAVNLDPRRAHEVIAGIPPHQVAAITGELVRRRDYVTMGRFVGQLSEEALLMSLQGVDDSALLQIGFLLEEKEQLPRVIGLLGDDRLDGLIEAAAKRGLWAEAIDLLDQLDDGAKRRILDSGLPELDDHALDELASAIVEDHLWDQALPLAEHLPDQTLDGLGLRLVEKASQLDPADREEVMEMVRRAGLLELGGELGEALRRAE